MFVCTLSKEIDAFTITPPQYDSHSCFSTIFFGVPLPFISFYKLGPEIVQWCNNSFPSKLIKAVGIILTNSRACTESLVQVVVTPAISFAMCLASVYSWRSHQGSSSFLKDYSAENHRLGKSKRVLAQEEVILLFEKSF